MLALAHPKFVIARGWCQSGFFQIGFQSLNPLNQLFFGKVVIFSHGPYIKLNCVMDKNNYYFFIYNGLPPNNSYFQKVITNILTQKHGVIQNKRYICNLIS